jgi:hypothetical protein
MPHVLTKAVLCSHCDKPIQRPAATLEQIFENLRESTSPDEQIPLACPHCSHVGLAFVDQRSLWFEIADLGSHPDGMTDYAVFLLCDQESCQLPALACIIHVVEGAKSLLCYKHVVRTVFEATKEASA